MRSPKPLILPMAAIALTIAGCAGKTEDPNSGGIPFEVSTFTPDLREHHTSWGHSGRGGAALRKPAYQPVLGSPDTLETRYGKLHPDLQARPAGSQASIEVPQAMYASKCAELGANTGDVQVFPQNANQPGDQITTLANGKGSVDDYISVRNKLCRGAMRLSYQEWEILVEGTPKDLPLHLQHKPSPSKP